MIKMHNVDFEQAVLAALMIIDKAYDEVSNKLQVESFLSERHKTIYSAITAIKKQGGSADALMVLEWLGSRKMLVLAGGEEYLVKLLTDTPASLYNLSQYVDRLNDLAVRRLSIEALDKARDQIVNNPERLACDVLSDAMGELGQASAQESDKGAVDMRAALRAQVAHMERVAADPDGCFGQRTGFVELDNQIGGMAAGDLIIIGARPSMGKELQNSALVYMIDGRSKQIGDVVVGDQVASVDGSASVVLGVYPQGLKDIYKVTFSDGRTVHAGIDHQWDVRHKSWSSRRVLTTSDVIDLLRKTCNKNRLIIPFCSGDFGSDVNLSIDPYLLGVLLGDGGLSSSGIRLSNSDDFILDKIKPSLFGLPLKHLAGVDYAIRPSRGDDNWLLSALQEFGLHGLRSHEKFIPENYMSASRTSRLSLLNGLIDTDGTVEKFGAMTYTTTSERMANQILSLTRSLGYWAKMRDRVTNYTYKGELKQGKRSYTITIQGAGMAELVTLPRKKERLANRLSSRNMNLTFASIEKIGRDECTCITVSHERSLFLTDEYIVTHNTTFAMNLVDFAAGQSGKPWLVISLEMPTLQITERLQSATAGVRLGNIRSGCLDEAEWVKYTAASAHLLNVPIHINDKGQQTLAEIRREAVALKRKYGQIGGVMVDYIGLMGGLDPNNKVNSIGVVSAGLKALAKELACPVVALSQLNRGLENRPNKRPAPSDLRESGSIEQDADIILFIYRDEVYNPESHAKGSAEIIIGKQRNGPLGTAILGFEGQYSRFTNIIRRDDVNYN
jgi:replicative DNA helicase